MSQTFDFEGEQRTVAQIRQLVPALTDSTIRKHLRAGRNTRAAMLTFDPAAAARAGARRGRAGSPKHGFNGGSR